MSCLIPIFFDETMVCFYAPVYYKGEIIGVLRGTYMAERYLQDMLAFSHSVAAVCRGAGKAFVPMIVMLSVWCVLRISYIIIVMRLFREIRYVFWAYPLTWSISSVIYLLYYLFSDWVHGFDA